MRRISFRWPPWRTWTRGGRLPGPLRYVEVGGRPGGGLCWLVLFSFCFFLYNS
jgi:hypothetical protein